MVAIKCQHLTVSIQFSLRQQFLSVIRTITVVNLKWLLVNSGILKAGHWRDRGLEEQGLGVSSRVCVKPEHCGQLNWFTIKMRFLFVLFTQGKFCKNIIYLFKLLFCKEIPQGQMKIFLFSCRRWQLVTYSLSCVHEQAVRGITLFFLLNPFSFSKTGIILISSHQQTYLLACKTLTFQCATISHWNKKKHSFFLSQQGINAHPRKSMSQQTRHRIRDMC